MIETVLALVVAIAIAAGIYYFIKKSTTLIINAVVGLITLFIVNYLDLFGMGDVPITLVSVIICALGGLPGAILVILLSLAGMPV